MGANPRKRTRRYAATCAVAACIVASLVALPLASSAFAGTTSPSQEEFRASLGTYLQNLQGALTAASKNPQTKGVVAPHLEANVKSIDAAESNLSSLNGVQLDAIQKILGLNPGWQEQPDVLREGLSQTGPMAPTSAAPGILTNCTANLGDARGLFYSTWAAAQAASVANAVASSLPDGVDYFPALIVAGVAYGVTNGLAIGLQDQLDRKLDCDAAEFNAKLTAAFPRKDPDDSSVTGPYAPASSQASVDALTTAAGDIDTVLNLITTVINTTTAKLTIVINNLGLAQNNTDQIQTTAMDLQARTIHLLSSIGTPTDHATGSPGPNPSGTANGLANTIDERQDTALANTASLQKLSVRLEIEESLAGPPNPSIALFALPASQGGYIETVRDIVTETIVNELAAGQTLLGDAQLKMAGGNDALAAGKYDQAFQLFAAAYRSAVG